jgi:hypothetical protein
MYQHHREGLFYLRSHPLRLLSITGCKFKDSDLAFLPSALVHLNMTCDPFITDAGMSRLRRYPLLRILILHDCDQITETGLGHLSSAPALRKFRMFGPHQHLTKYDVRHFVASVSSGC